MKAIFIRTNNLELWRQAKSQAALEGKTLKQWVEDTLKKEIGKSHPS